jgi:putative ABC transport system ATP-binding protein
MSVVIDDLTVEYSSGGYVLRPLNGFSVTAGPGELVLVLGASGCGKTTLLSVLAGILKPSSGTVSVGTRMVSSLIGEGLVRYRRFGVGIVFQAFNLVPSLSASENVQVPLLLAGRPRRQARRRADELLDRVGLTDRSHHRPSELSGGQQQRVAIARALALDPPLLLADEPTAHLDYIQVEGILTVLKELASAGRTVIMATHDERLLPIADQVVELTPRFPTTVDGVKHVMLGPGDVLFSQGDPSDFVYVINRGRIEIFRGRPEGANEVLARLGRGQYFGELGPALNLQRSASARAMIRTSLTAYTPQAFRRRIGTSQHNHTARPVRAERSASTASS